MPGNSRNSTLQLAFLVLRSQAGDESAFRDLYLREGTSTLRYLNGIVGVDSANDVQQEVWITVYKRLPTLDNPRRFRAWLYRISRTKAIDQLRRQQREERLLDSSIDLGVMEVPSSDERGLASIDTVTVRKVISTLSPVHQEVLILRYWEGMSYGEISQIIDKPIGTIRSRLFHAKKLLEQNVVLQRETI